MHQEQAWARQLAREYETINYERGTELTPPLIIIGSGKNQLGCWQRANRSITISRQLICERSWDDVCQILRHEMAHQYVDEELQAHNSVPHGDEFQLAAELLGLAHRFRGATCKFADEESREISARERKIQKLFALAGSSEIHEAEAAMNKAQQLILSYNLELPKAERTPFCYRQIVVANKKVPSWIKHLCAIIQEHFFVQSIIIPFYQAMEDQEVRAVELIGRRENVEIAEHAFIFLQTQIPKLWLEYKRTYRVPAGDRNSYYLGVLKGFAEKLKKCQCEAIKTEEMALALQPESALLNFYRQRYPRISTTRGSGPRLKKDSYDSGKAAGGKLTIHKTMGSKTRAGKTRLLG